MAVAKHTHLYFIPILSDLHGVGFLNHFLLGVRHQPESQ